MSDKDFDQEVVKKRTIEILEVCRYMNLQSALGSLARNLALASVGVDLSDDDWLSVIESVKNDSETLDKLMKNIDSEVIN